MTYTEEELEALAAAAGVKWAEHQSGSEYWAWLDHHRGMSSGKNRQEAMNIYWNRYINGELERLR